MLIIMISVFNLLGFASIGYLLYQNNKNIKRLVELVTPFYEKVDVKILEEKLAHDEQERIRLEQEEKEKIGLAAKLERIEIERKTFRKYAGIDEKTNNQQKRISCKMPHELVKDAVEIQERMNARKKSLTLEEFSSTLDKAVIENEGNTNKLDFIREPKVLYLGDFSIIIGDKYTSKFS